MAPNQNHPAIIAVVLPLYNKARYVRRALESVAKQTFGDFEAIIVDDGSTDGSGDIVAAFGDGRFRLVRQANAGPGAARNRGMREATAPLVAFLDADDEWLPEHLAAAIQCLGSHPQCAIYCAAHVAEPGGRRTAAVSWAALGVAEGVQSIEAVDGSKRLWDLRTFFTPSSAIVVRRAAALELGGFYEHRCTYREDAWLITQLLLRSPAYLNMQPTVVYHLDASELGYAGRKGRFPLEPLLEDPEPARRNCPPEKMRLLEELRSRIALQAAHRSVKRYDDWGEARAILGKYPQARRLRREYVRTMAGMVWLTLAVPVSRLIRSSPLLVRCGRALRRFLRRGGKSC